MVRVEIEKGKEFFDILKGLSNIFPSIVLIFGAEGMRCSMIDFSKTFMIKWQIPRNAFSVYEVEDEREVIINLDKFIKSKFKVNNNESLIIETKDSEASLLFRIENSEGRKKEFKIREYTKDSEVSDLLVDKEINLQTDVFAIIPYEVLKEISSYELDTDLLIIKAKEDKLCLERIEDGNLNAAIIELQNGTQDLISYDFKAEAKSMYRVPMLKSSLEVLGISTFTALEFSMDSPLIMSADSTFGGIIKVIIAPTVI